jgi:hydantoinase/carbamoylase family amidase
VIAARPSAEWLGTQLEALATFNDAPELGGVTREVFTPTYARALAHVSGLMEEAGLTPRIDAFGNLFGTLAGEGYGGSILTGSHIDTTLNAGRYDGVVGVLGAIEAVRMLREGGFRPSRSIAVVVFAGEEPRFGVGCLGSRALVGELDVGGLAEMRDRDGVSLAEALALAGLDPDRVGEAVLEPGSIAGMVELHVEQGSILEDRGAVVGVVERISAPHDVRIVIEGEARHSGTTPMRSRRDAMVGAAEAIIALEAAALASPSPTTVGTVGVLEAHPGAINVVAGRVELLADIRDWDVAARAGTVEAFLGAVRHACAGRGLAVSVDLLASDDPLECAPSIVGAVRGAVRDLGVEALDMVSGAYHDAMIIGRHFPAGMIFAPSARGISHSPDEHTALKDLVPAVSVLAATLGELAR